MKILLLLLISSSLCAQKPQLAGNNSSKLGIANRKDFPEVNGNLNSIPPKDTANYFLVGKLADFQLLYKAVADPDNVTRKQVSDLAHWLVQARAILPDTTKLNLPKPPKK